jgi:hypothetical protein
MARARPRNAKPGETVTYFENEVVVAEPCDPNAAGHHYCATHGEGFTNNLSVNSHAEEPGEHVLVWACFVHGPESPDMPKEA